MPHPTTQSGTRWKLALMLLVGLFLVASAASFVIAARRVSRVVDTDYYSHGLRYGQEQSANAGHHWTLTPAVSGADLTVQVQDQLGAPIAGGRLSFEPNQAGNRPAPSLQLSEAAPGMFRAPRPAAAPGGELRGTLRFTLGHAVASRKLVLFN